MTPPTTTLTFIRHGETDWNRQQRFQGQIDVPLNAAGHAQAARLPRALAGSAPDVFLSSDLARAQETAAPLARAWGQPPQLLPGLREQSFGIFEGLDLPAIRAQHEPLWQDWLQYRADFNLPGGESLREFSARVLQSVQALAQTHSGRTVVVVTHGGVLDMLWRHAHGKPLDGPRECAIPNTGINRLRWVGGRLLIDDWADAAHLAGLPEQAAT
jgi:2,3-bisphosphoglycerate-dependent phosphoglycerate mutase